MSTHEPERAERGHELRAVDHRETFLRLESNRLEPGRRERVAALQQLSVEPRSPFPDQWQGEVCEWREVAACTDRPAARDVGQKTGIQQREQCFDELDARTGRSFRERIGAQEQSRTNDLVGVRIADTARVAAEQSDLQLFGLLLRDRPRHEPAEARVHAVGVLARAVRRPLDEIACRAHALARRVAQLRGRPFDGDRPDVGQAKVVTRQADRSRLRHLRPV